MVFFCLPVDEWSLVLEIELDDAQGHWTSSSIKVVSVIGGLTATRQHVNNAIIRGVEIERTFAQRSKFIMMASEGKPATWRARCSSSGFAVDKWEQKPRYDAHHDPLTNLNS